MSGRSRGDAIIAGALLVLALVFLALTSGFEPASRFVPLSVLVPLVPLLGWCLVRALRLPAPARNATDTAVRGSRDLPLIAWTLALPFLATVAGMVVGPALFVAAWLRARGRERWPVAIAGGGATAVALWLLMVVLLDAATPVTVLPGWLAR